MGFIHSHQGNGNRPAKPLEIGGQQALRGDIEYFELTQTRLKESFGVFPRSKHGIDVGGRNAHARQRGHLVLHQ